MSAKIEYKCNICQEVITDKDNLRCMYWDATYRNDLGNFGEYVFMNDVRKSDKHICVKCIELIKKIK